MTTLLQYGAKLALTQVCSRGHGHWAMDTGQRMLGLLTGAPHHCRVCVICNTPRFCWQPVAVWDVCCTVFRCGARTGRLGGMR